MGGLKFRLSTASGPLSVDDYRRLARKKLPDMVWGFVDGAAEDHHTLDANRAAFSRWSFLPRVLTGKEGVDLRCNLVGTRLDLPVFLAPTGMTGMAHWAAEPAAARAAEACGTRAIISTAASYTPEEVAAATSENHVFQLYPWASSASGARGLTESFIKRAHQADYAALAVTLDVPVHGNREGERRRGMTVPPVLTPGRILNAARKPRWWLNFLRHQRIGARLLLDERGAGAAVKSAEIQMRLMRPELTWDDLSWMRDLWDRPLLVKGVLHPEDAVEAVRRGANGVVVSNHGGRQLDGAVGALDALPAIVAAVGAQVPVYLDGGVRRGSDVVKALCLGASGVGIGRPYLYGLAADGQAGVEHVLQIFREEIGRTLTLLGCASTSELGPHLLTRAATGPVR
ncbi:L-lactate dehydrogenase (cytochrome)/(S)-mandelate dehydrogenase [Nocardioides sp. J9]|uniref:alpha-hydroxy acid oxidase n=1 Tax=Nocardioides sp. J9 TaxID=935844 RepID=UPI0011A8EBE7|nr:alpha-hydroxy acid oxidase [Nocardioides sp. J9]TWG98569.1 L-lactate dehydrogenase (cytochrome)/(S)-mandelate dehydrogenase [Nocardioides sp. J9]